MKGQYIIVDLKTMEYFKTVEGDMMFFDTDEDALLHCGIYELPNAWVMKLIYNHIDLPHSRRFHIISRKI